MYSFIKKQGFKILMLGLSAMLAGIITTSCNSSEKKTEEPQQTTETMKPIIDTAAVKADWKIFKHDADEKISETRDSLEAFKKRIAKADKKLKAVYERRVAELEQKNAELKQKLEDYKDEGKEKWEDFKVSFNREMDKLKQELKDSTTYNAK